MTELLIQWLPLGEDRLRQLVEEAWHVHKDDPLCTPPLRLEHLGSRVEGRVSLLIPRHSRHQHAEVTHFPAGTASEPPWCPVEDSLHFSE